MRNTGCNKEGATENYPHMGTENSTHIGTENSPHMGTENSPHMGTENSPTDGAQLICTGYRVQGFEPQVSKLTASSKCHPLHFILISEMPHEYHQSDLDDESDCDGARGRHDLC